MSEQHIWDLWFPDAAAQGLPFARGRLDATGVLLVHAAPEVLDVDVWSDEGWLVARGTNLRRSADRPMARLFGEERTVVRQDLWPDQSDLGRPVILPSGEVGILMSWSHAADGSSWRWQVEISSHR